MTVATNDPLLIAAERIEAGVRARSGLGRPAFASIEQEAFFDSRAPELLYSGWMGAGKSRILCEKAWWLALRHPGSTMGIFRKVASSLPATTMRTFFRDVADPSYIVDRNRSEGWVEVAAGRKPSRIYFLGLDPDPITGVPSKVGSLDLAWAGVDEAIELTEADWIMLQGRLRDPAMPWHQLAAATNAGSPRHWLKARFTPPTADRAYLAASENRFLPDDYRARLASLPDNVHGRRLGRGLWVAADGVIWTLPDDQIRPADQGEWHAVVAGIDWGFVHAFACEVVGISGSGRLAVIDEVYEKGALLEQLIPRLRDLRAEHGIAVFLADPSEPEYIATCRAHGLPVEPAVNDVGPGLNSVAAAIAEGMTVDPRCEALLAEILEYVWAPDRLHGGFRERPVEVNDDACDALRYAVHGITGPREMPELVEHEPVYISPV